MTGALINGRILRGEKIVEGFAVLIEGARIVAVLPHDDARVAAAAAFDLRGNLLFPGFIDTQVNGGGGVLFNDAPSVESIRAIGAAHRKFGTTGFLPTLISDDLHVIETAMSAVAGAIRSGVPGVLGIHVEGPFLSPERKGVHDIAKLRELDAGAVKLLSRPIGGRTLVTLAPELTTPAFIRELADAGVIVSAGHSNANYAEVNAALGAGLRGFTHLFNAMSQLGSREPGVVGAALEDLRSYCGIIVDGVHVDPVTLKLALRCKPHNRFMLVTDAMPDAGTDVQEFLLQGQRIVVRDGKLLDETGKLAGARLNMAQAVGNAVKLLGLDLADAVTMASTSPAGFLRLENELGAIEAGHRANLVLADDRLEVLDTWIDGQRAT
jgi:N-acetylglucosamine-6-phosphate deacetylase